MLKFLFILIIVVAVYDYIYFYETGILKNRVVSFKKINNVPNIVYRTIHDKNITMPMLENCHNSWIKLNPDYTFLWFNCKEQDAFMKEHFYGNVYEAYSTLKPGAYKADLWRLCILYKYGGIYLDAYARPFVPFSEMFKNCSDCRFISILDCGESGSGIHNGFIVSEAEHPFLKQGIQDIIKNVKNRYYGNSALDPTGPNALKKSIGTVVGKKYIKHKEGVNKGGYYLFKLYWGPYQNVYDGDKKIFCKYYSFQHYKYRKMTSNGYAKMWDKKDIYN
jgi:hypothetical protein